MTGCSYSCKGKDQAAYRVAMTHKVFVLCADHAAYATNQGLTLIPVERRVGNQPVATDRRRFARWVRSNLARDWSGRNAA